MSGRSKSIHMGRAITEVESGPHKKSCIGLQLANITTPKPGNLEFDRITRQYSSPMVSTSAYCCILNFPKLNFWGDITAFASLRLARVLHISPGSQVTICSTLAHEHAEGTLCRMGWQLCALHAMAEMNTDTWCSAPQLPALQKEDPLPCLVSDVSNSVLAPCIPAGCDHLHCFISLD